MLGPGQLSSLASKRLRYFRYSPPPGGFGGDYDLLSGEARFVDDADLQRILGAIGYAGTPPLTQSTTNLGFFTAGGVRISISVTRQPSSPYVGTARNIQLTVAVYVTEAHIADACRLEAWLDAQQNRDGSSAPMTWSPDDDQRGSMSSEAFPRSWTATTAERERALRAGAASARAAYRRPSPRPRASADRSAGFAGTRRAGNRGRSSRPPTARRRRG